MNSLMHLAEQHPVWNFLLMLGTAIIAWLAPVAALVTIGCGAMHAYIAWQKYKAWKQDRANG